jgi:hypothetical protein
MFHGEAASAMTMKVRLPGRADDHVEVADAGGISRASSAPR